MKEKEYTQEDEIDLLELLQKVWEGRKLIVKTTIICTLIGLFIALFSAKEYTANAIVVPQMSESKPEGGLSGLAAMAGIDMKSGSSGTISPMLYPKVVQSVPFQRALLQVPLQFSGIEGEVTYKEYYENHQKLNLLSFLKKYTIGLPGVIVRFFKKDTEQEITVVKNDDIYKVSQEEKKFFKQLKGQLRVESNDKEGFVSLSFSMPEALPAAQMVRKSQELLEKTITDFKVQKAKDELNFIEERCAEAKKDFDRSQMILANFRDKNRGLSNARSQTRLERLQSDYNLAFNLYLELAKKLEAQKIKVKENTPVFTEIQPVSVPIEKSKPQRLMILIIWIFLGVVIGVSWVFGKDWIKSLKQV